MYYLDLTKDATLVPFILVLKWEANRPPSIREGSNYEWAGYQSIQRIGHEMVIKVSVIVVVDREALEAK